MDANGQPVPLDAPAPPYGNVGEWWVTEMVENPTAVHRGETPRADHYGISYRTRCAGCTEAVGPEDERLIQDAIRTRRPVREFRWDLERMQHMGRALDRPY
jgi:hypothetical protein